MSQYANRCWGSQWSQIVFGVQRYCVKCKISDECFDSGNNMGAYRSGKRLDMRTHKMKVFVL